MKRFVSVLCVLLLCLTALCWAEGGEELPDAERIVFSSGESMELSLKITAQLAGLQAKIAWDPAQLELISDPLAFAPDFKRGAMVSMINPEPELGMITLVYLRQKDMVAEAMEVLPLAFRVREDAISGIAEISVCDLQMVDAQNNGVDAIGEGVNMEIVGAIPAPESSVSPEATETPEPTAEPEPTLDPEQIPEARMYLEWILPEEPEDAPTAEPTEAATAEPTVEPTVKATEEPTQKPEMTPEPTVKPAPTPTRPSGHIDGGSVGSSATATPKPTAAPTATPEPTVPTIEIGGAAPSPKPENQISGNLVMKAKAVEGGVVVELFARNAVIGGLQAEICYDETLAELEHAFFSDAFLNNAMIQMINDSQPGKISLVYSNLSGYEADGSAIFTAQFRCEDAAGLQFDLVRAKYTGASIDLDAVQIADQRVQCEIQPMDDLTIVEEDGVRILEIAEGDSFSVTLDQGDVIALRVKDHEIANVCWSVDRDEIVSVSTEGLCEAHSSGLVLLSARNAADGKLLAEGRLCVRNADFGIPLEISSMSVGDAVGEMFVLSGDVDPMAYQARGIELVFRDNGMTIRIAGLLPEEMRSIPASAFDLCGNLTEVDIFAENILEIESEAFLRCASLEKITLRNPQTVLQESALPDDGDCVLAVPADSVAAKWAAQAGIPVQIIESEVQ